MAALRALMRWWRVRRITRYECPACTYVMLEDRILSGHFHPCDAHGLNVGCTRAVVLYGKGSKAERLRRRYGI